ncbi:hypothetical protein BIW11_04079 [Tropilaelaps mercedesae]|uniref:Uncharacterized protein n=1 Tax=Tropilaelaps mercedesae TaxID=418985 RepID=A0A1V9XBE4_9ACAR|nr:hypothetical protein BIW11_04079 [Tropilaelaps mercedesae]
MEAWSHLRSVTQNRGFLLEDVAGIRTLSSPSAAAWYPVPCTSMISPCSAQGRQKPEEAGVSCCRAESSVAWAGLCSSSSRGRAT